MSILHNSCMLYYLMMIMRYEALTDILWLNFRLIYGNADTTIPCNDQLGR